MIDVLVAGGGPVGLAAALYAARAGLDVLVVEPRTAPVDKACGEGLLPGALARVVDLTGSPGPVGHDLRGIRYVDRAGRQAVAAFPHGPGRGVRRTELHRGLQDAVAAAGIEVRAGRVDAVQQDAVAVSARVGAGGVRARYLLAADGLHSGIRSGLGLAGGRGAHPRYGLRRHYAVRPWTDLVEVHWGPLAEAYVTPVGRREVGVAVLTAHRRPFEAQLALFPELVRRLRSAAPTSVVRGAGPLRQVASRRVAGRVLLVGDAAGYVDALTGEGVAVGLAGAAAAVRSVAADRPADYERDWRSVSRQYRWLTGALVGVARQPTARRLVVPAAAVLPGVFGAAVARLAR